MRERTYSGSDDTSWHWARPLHRKTVVAIIAILTISFVIFQSLPSRGPSIKSKDFAENKMKDDDLDTVGGEEVLFPEPHVMVDGEPWQPPQYADSAKPAMTPGTVPHNDSYNKNDGSHNMTKLVETVRKVRILCLILTMEKDLETKVDAVNRTWATRCDKHLYLLYTRRNNHDFLRLDIPDTRKNLIHKVRSAFSYIYAMFRNDFDFIFKCDDDTYVVVENLKFLLSHYDPSKPGYLGFHFNKWVKSGYMSGGAGYVISNSGLRKLVVEGYDRKRCPIMRRRDDPENSEDIETGRCLETVGVPVLSSLDQQGRETFHPYQLEKYLLHSLPGYMYSWPKNPTKTGRDCCSKYVISFHYVPPDAMLYMDHLLYNTAVFGLDQSLPEGPVFKLGQVT